MNNILSFDTLKYANRLKEINVPPEQAELQAEVMKEVLETAFQMAELATKSDVNNAIVLVRKDMDAMEQRLNTRIDASEQGLSAKIDACNARIDASEQRLGARIDANNAKIDALASKLIIQIAGLIMAGIGATAAIVALLPKLFA